MKKFFNPNEEFRFNEILFEGRNKQYGAFVLRNESDRILTKSMFLGIGLFAAVVLVPLVASSLNKTEDTVVTVSKDPKWVPIDPVDPPIVNPPAPPPQQAQKTVKTFNSTVPTPVKITNKETPAAAISNYEKETPGFKDSEGTPPINTVNPPAVSPSGNVGTVPVTPPNITKDPNTVAARVDVGADFSGGIESFRKKVGQNFDTGYFEGSGERITAHVTFIVEKDGTISNVTATGADLKFNKEAERTVKSIKGKWIPAKLGGENVRSYFKIPITIQFE